ncbi:SufI multicopper oxidase [Pyrenophora tritici-repentis]|uniref:Multicopper oxidase n=3 Tax=Pyrenophora tritici-repentis TaxID=45151 RepID=A0A2W1D132_9PLEO|nr:Multicopper oxidase [Pyrenophora tritici-repentis]KAI0605637.1 Multicopper oxidase [Pyrenophora tritici-repentis]KAI0617604.1 Multicopper oxidase [Pyrenophora tritici-repentis]KAI1507303.1 Multicopper oxidase [Pyrenophora tritici-repentis]KAI1544455.1 SufI multicopper oxidase [Pyrenophora tritici-repentis]
MFFTSWLTAGLLLTTAHASSCPKRDEHGQNTANTTRVHTHDAAFKPDFYLSVTYENHAVACEQRMSVLVNGTSPGPALRLPAGKTSWVRVCNNMEEFNTTIHWHGLSQRTAPFSDGTPVSQWPIAPHKCFDYEIHPEEQDAGTYFYHSHVGFQAISAAGPLIVEDFGLSPYQYDEERIVFVQDYYNKTDEVIEKGLLAIPFVWSGEVNAVLINGIGVATGQQAGQAHCELPVIDVEPGKTYRFRFVGATIISIVKFGIEDHPKWDVIEADGSYTKPTTADHIQVSSGQRFDALLRTKSAAELGSKTEYIIQFETRDRPAVYTGFAILRYPGSNNKTTTAPTVGPLHLPNTTYDWLAYALEPFAPNNFPTAAEVTRRIHITMAQIRQSLTVWQLDGLNWTESSPKNTPPYLVSIYKNGRAAMPNYTAAIENGGWDPHTLTWPAKLGEVLEIIVENTGSAINNSGGLDYHPIHLHGKHFHHIGEGFGPYDPVENERKLANYTPVLRDTVNLYRPSPKGVTGQVSSWTGMRLRVEAAGVWLLHCHIAQHMIMGMQSAWIMGDYDDIAGIPYRGAEGYLDFGGNAYASDSEDTPWPQAYHNFD